MSLFIRKNSNRLYSPDGQNRLWERAYGSAFFEPFDNLLDTPPQEFNNLAFSEPFDNLTDTPPADFNQNPFSDDFSVGTVNSNYTTTVHLEPFDT